MNDMRLLAATFIALAVVAVPTVAGAEETFDYTAGRECILRDGSGRLAEGSFRIVWPTEYRGPNGFHLPDEATGTIADIDPTKSVTPLPCAPNEPTPEPTVEPVAQPVAEVEPVALVAPVAPASPYVAIRNAMLDLQTMLVANGGW